jgi:uncharacterized protein
LSVASAAAVIPPLNARVTDESATLTGEQRSALEQTWQAFEAKKESQISVLIVYRAGRRCYERAPGRRRPRRKDDVM